MELIQNNIKMEDSSSASVTIPMSTDAEDRGADARNQRNAVIKTLTARMDVLEKQWLNYFGDVQPPPNPNGAQASATTTVIVDQWASGIKEEPAGDNVPQYIKNPLDEPESCLEPSKKTKPCRAPFKCPICDETLKDRKGVKAHMADTHAHLKKVYECWSCSVVFMTRNQYRSHSNQKHCFKCGFCNKILSGEYGRQDHVKSVHGFDSKTCPACEMDVKAFNHDQFVAHLAEHEIETATKFVFSCLACPKPRYFRTEQQRATHVNKKHSKQA